MRNFTRSELFNLAYYGGAALFWIAATALLAFGHAAAAMWAAASSLAWIVGVSVLMVVFEPVLNRWCNSKEEIDNG